MIIMNKIEKLIINVKNDFTPRLPPIIIIKAKRIISKIKDVFIF